MDPVSAVGLAAVILQFLQFAGQVVSKTVEIHGSSEGATKRNADIEVVVSKFQELNLQLQPLQSSHIQPQNELLDLSDQCAKLASELLDHLGKLKKHPDAGSFRSIRAGLKAVTSKGYTDALKLKFDEFRHLLTLKLLVDMKKELEGLDIQRHFGVLDSKITVLLDAVTKSPLTFTQVVEKNNTYLDHQLDQIQSSLDNLGKRVREEGDRIEIEGRKTRKYIHEISVNKTQDDQLRDLLESLWFPKIDARQHHIEYKIREAQAYEWILSEYTTKPETGFTEWLQGGEPVYWIQGKAGSGKSTLMSVILNDSRLKRYLNRWAKGKRLIVASYFFWRVGEEEMQHTIPGLLQTILYSILQQAPELVTIVLGALAQKIQNFKNHSWTILDLRACLERLLVQDSTNVKIALFIDGLDEYSGNHIEIVKLIGQLVSHSQVKICLSSRPMATFITSFSSRPGLHLHEINDSDIQRYVNEQLQSETAWTQRSEQTRWRVVDAICAKAEGVFIWVVVVIQSIIQGVYESDTDSQLLNHIDYLHSDIFDLYMQMLDMVESHRHRQQALVLSFVYWINTFRVEDPLFRKAVPYSLVLLANDEKDVGHGSPFLYENELQRAANQLRASCLGLIEVITAQPSTKYAKTSLVGHRLACSHKTVLDFLNVPAVQQKLINRLAKDKGLGQAETMLKWCVIHARHFAGSPWDTCTMMMDALVYAKTVIMSGNQLHDSVIDEIGELCFAATRGSFTAFMYQSVDPKVSRQRSWLYSITGAYDSKHLIDRMDNWFRSEINMQSHKSISTESRKTIEHPDDFLHLAAIYELHGYVQRKIEAIVDPEEKNVRASNVLNDIIWFQTPISPKQVEILFKNGAKYSLCYKHNLRDVLQRLWEHWASQSERELSAAQSKINLRDQTRSAVLLTALVSETMDTEWLSGKTGQWLHLKSKRKASRVFVWLNPSQILCITGIMSELEEYCFENMIDTHTPNLYRAADILRSNGLSQFKVPAIFICDDDDYNDDELAYSEMLSRSYHRDPDEGVLRGWFKKPLFKGKLEFGASDKTLKQFELCYKKRNFHISGFTDATGASFLT